MPPSHLIRSKTNLMVAFLLIDMIGMSVHHSHLSACHGLRSVIKTRVSSYGTGRIFDRLKNLTRHFVHTEPFNIFALFTRNRRTSHLSMLRALLQQIQTGISQPSYHASMQLRLCRTKFQTVMAFTPGRSNFSYKNLDGYGVHIASVKFSPMPALNLTSILVIECLNGLVLPSADAQSANIANPNWRLPAQLPRIHATASLLYEILDGHGVHNAPVKFSTVPA